MEDVKNVVRLMYKILLNSKGKLVVLDNIDRETQLDKR